MKHQTTHATKTILNRLYTKFSDSKSAEGDFIALDPVQFPLHFAGLSKKNLADVEIAAFLTATIAWGRRDIILRSAQKMFALMEGGPSAYISSGAYKNLKERGDPLDRSLHRTFFGGDLKYFCRGFKSCYEKYGSLEALFAGAGDVWQGIGLFRDEMAIGNKGAYSKHIANPEDSACKRVNLALRWLVRKGPVDFGLWTRIDASALYIPLDVHVARNARKLGLLKRKSNDRKAVVELTENLRELCPEDPVKYDFALFDSAAIAELS